MKKPYTKQEVEAAKAKYPRVVRELEIYPSDTEFDKEGKPDQEPAYFLIKKPNKILLDMLGGNEYKKDAEAANKAMLDNCVLKGDMELMENDASVYTALLENLANLVQAQKVTLKKL